jgi:hypothetical protein
MMTMTDAQADRKTAAETVEEAARRLEVLGTEVEKLGFRARLVIVAGRPPALYVQNPEPGARALQEDIYAAPRESCWWFWWSWAEVIAESAAEAASLIARALRSAG